MYNYYQDLNFKSSKNVWGYFSVSSTGGIHEFADSQFGHCFSWGETRYKISGLKTHFTILTICKMITNKASLSFGRTSAGILWCFWGMFHTIETTTMDHLISELALKYMNQKNIWYQNFVKSCISIREITSAHKAI